MFFHNDGWHSFVKDNLLKIGDFLVFRYDGESKFKVKFFDRTCCEKDVEVVKRRSGCPASPANEGNQLAGVQDEEVIDLETENYKKHTEKKTRTAGRRIRKLYSLFWLLCSFLLKLCLIYPAPHRKQCHAWGGA